MKRPVLFLSLVMLLCSTLVNSIGVDMGTCSCLCGVDDASGGSSVVLGKSGAESDFYTRLRGPKGDLGRPGKPGSLGPPGHQGNPGIKGEPGRSFGNEGSRATPSESCFHLRESGQSRSGVYTIQPTESSSPIEVFCDMESAGGGWTLVASIHENNIYGKCTSGDLWSSDQGKSSEKYPGNGNWENFNTFGSAEGATSGDYKSPAYYSLQASDVMVWHVPNDVEISQASTDAKLKYYTNTGFLRDYGGTLQSMYSKHFPLKTAPKPGATMEGVTSLIAALNQSAAETKRLVPNFYDYVYDFDGNVQNYIKDGGQDMFDTGNKLFYRIGSNPETQITYNTNYRNRSQGVDLLAATSHPFNLLMWIGNDGGAVDMFSLKVLSGTGADGDGSSRTRDGTITQGDFTLVYHAYSVYGASDPSISEVFYYITNTNTWQSRAPTAFTKNPWSGGTDSLQHGVVVSGGPKSILMGYTLLSRTSDGEVDESSIRAVLNRTLTEISNFGKIDEFNCSRLEESLVQPVLYLQGNNDEVLNKIPPVAKSQTTPGFLQFRAYSPTGIPNALCPGVKTEACRSQSVCIGGVNTMANDEKSCGDFAGWEGLPGDTPTQTEPDGSARSLDDVNTSVLIFTRKQA
uniref:uncharacterized protein LOC120332903 n=1 Tax=Styela clava TaxID=7725 RepID=UPI0019396607|nr:uncharacterized protein LOC120332903 [Styela clava]